MQIVELIVEERESDIYVKCVFEIDKTNDYFRVFRNESLEFRKASGILVEPEDYLTYLFDDEEYDVNSFNENYFIPLENGCSKWIAPPSPYSNLLSARKHLIEVVVNPLFSYNSVTNSFTFQEYLEKNNTVRGIILDLQELKETKNSSKFVEEAFLIRLFTSLIQHWD